MYDCTPRRWQQVRIVISDYTAALIRALSVLETALISSPSEMGNRGFADCRWPDLSSHVGFSPSWKCYGCVVRPIRFAFVFSGGPLEPESWVRQTHRWLSIAFTVGVIVLPYAPTWRAGRHTV